ncbi:MAG: chromate transporter [Clostridia bacterium]|nr:chromate transporter [Clostridia bacterium]
MKRDKDVYARLFLSTFKLSACTFGGGYVIIPLMRKRFVEDLHWIDEQEMLNLTAIAQSSPGPIAVNASILVGYQVAGAAGALLTVLGTVLPPLVIISIVSLFYQAFRDNAIANMALAGMLCGVAAVVLDVVVNMARSVFRQKRLLPLLIMAASFVALRFFSVNILLIILACALIGAADTWVRGRKGAGT